VDPELVARKVAAMSLGRAQAREARLAGEVQLLVGLSVMDRVELGRHSSTRKCLCAAAEC